MRREIVPYRDQMFKYMMMHLLVAPTTLDAIRVFFWAIAAYNDGSIDNVRFEVDTKEPYVDIVPGKAREKERKFANSLKNYINGLIS